MNINRKNIEFNCEVYSYFMLIDFTFRKNFRILWDK